MYVKVISEHRHSLFCLLLPVEGVISNLIKIQTWMHFIWQKSTIWIQSYPVLCSGVLDLLQYNSMEYLSYCLFIWKLILKNSDKGCSLTHAVNTCITLLKALTTWWLLIYCLLTVMERPYSKGHKSACITWKYWKATQNKSGKSHYAESCGF